MALGIKYSFYKSQVWAEVIFWNGDLVLNVRKHEADNYAVLTTRPRSIPCNSCTWGCSGHRWQGRHHGITIPIRWNVPTPKACISYIRRSLAMSDSALSLYPGNSQSVEDSSPRRGTTLLWLHLLWAAHTLLSKIGRGKTDLSTSALSGCRMHRPLSISMVLMLRL